MISDYSTRTVCVIDNGHFTEFAVRLARDFGRVYYWSPWQNAFPTTAQLTVGQDVPDIIRIDSIWPHLAEIDLFVFTDLYHSELQLYLESIGKRVWGARHGEELELDRAFFKETVERLKLPIMPYDIVTGITSLRRYLDANWNTYVKISRTRGDKETFRSDSGPLVDLVLDDLGHKLGAMKEHTEFIVEQEIPDAVEVAADLYTVDGRFPETVMSGIEIKDAGYLGHVRPYKTVAPPIRAVYDAFQPTLQQYRVRSMWATEIRVTRDGTPFAMDPCCRMGSPPSELELELIANLSDVLWYGAGGEMVDWEPTGEWGASISLESPWAREHWQPVEFPERYRNNIKLRYLTRLDEQWYIVPVGHSLSGIGAVVAVGETPEEAISEVVRIADMIKGPEICAAKESMGKALEQVENFKRFGYDL